MCSNYYLCILPLVVLCKFNTKTETVMEGKDTSVSLTASCRGRYQRTISIAVKCDPTEAEGVIAGV